MRDCVKSCMGNKAGVKLCRSQHALSLAPVEKLLHTEERESGKKQCHVCVYIHPYIYIYICTQHIYTTSAFVYVYVYVFCMCMHIHRGICVCMYMYLHMYMYIYICICIMYICIYVHVYGVAKTRGVFKNCGPYAYGFTYEDDVPFMYIFPTKRAKRTYLGGIQQLEGLKRTAQANLAEIGGPQDSAHI